MSGLEKPGIQPILLRHGKFRPVIARYLEPEKNQRLHWNLTDSEANMTP
jgi:hypothetical protein